MNWKDKISLRIKELCCIILLIIAKFFSLFLKEKDIWLVCERGSDARDNGYWFYRYVQKNHPDQSMRYLISHDSPDRIKIEKENFRIINYRSFKHLIYLTKATHLISTHKNGFSPWPYSFLYRKNGPFKNKKIIFLQHGITKELIPNLFSETTQLDLFICGSRIEYEFVLREFGYSDQVVKYTGLCRFDNLNNFLVEKIILIMPTWRKYINVNSFNESVYFKQFKNLLKNPDLHTIANKNGYKIIFYPHHELQPYLNYFYKEINDKNIVFASKEEYDVQELLKRAEVLITDYSSVFFDFGYMRKPIIYFQFDEEEYHKKHYAQGYFDFHNGFGAHCTSIKEVINQLKETLRNGCKIGDEYNRRISMHFLYNDSRNSERVYRAIKEIP